MPQKTIQLLGDVFDFQKIWEWIQDLTSHGIIDTKRSGSGQRGQTTLIGLSDVPAEMLEQYIAGLLDSQEL